MRGASSACATGVGGVRTSGASPTALVGVGGSGLETAGKMLVVLFPPNAESTQLADLDLPGAFATFHDRDAF